MRKVKLITDVAIEEVLCDRLDSIECRFFNPATMSIVHQTNEVLATQSVEKHVVPIKSWVEYKCCGNSGIRGICLAEGCREGHSKEEGYIAMSPKIDETLGKYIEILNKETQRNKELAEFERKRKEETYSELLEARKGLGKSMGKLTDLISLVQEASFWKRLKYLFTGRLD